MSEKMDVLGEYKRSHASERILSRKLGIPKTAIGCWLRKNDLMVKEWLECVRLADEGKLQVFLSEAQQLSDDDRKTMTDYKRENAYLRARLAYYEEIAKECGIDFSGISKKNDTGQSKEALPEKKET
jgi:hypothetical protein